MTEQEIHSFCIACGDSFPLERKNQKRCRDCIVADRRPSKKGEDVEVTGTANVSLAEARRVLEDEGFGVVKPRGFRAGESRTFSETQRIGVVSDTHIGSIYQQMSHLHSAYRWFAKEKVDVVMHVGDMFDGSPRMHKDAPEHLFLHSPTAAVRYVRDNYPKEKGITTYFIGGNHDASFIKNERVDACAVLAEERDDLVYMGPDVADVSVKQYQIRLHHPDGAGALHASKARQIIDREPHAEDIGDLLLVGHLHRVAILPQYRGILAIEVPSFQGQSLYLKRKGYTPDVGALILDFAQTGADQYGVPVASVRWMLYEPYENDF